MGTFAFPSCIRHNTTNDGMGPGESMSIWHLLFGFDGRINRKTYIIAIIALMLVMAALMLAGAAVATGDPLSSSLWAFRRENIGIWGPIYAGVICLRSGRRWLSRLSVCMIVITRHGSVCCSVPA